MTCGNRPVSSRTRRAASARYDSVVRCPSAIELVARRPVAKLRLVAEREQRLLAARLVSGARDGAHRVMRQIGRLSGARRMGKGAVVADVTAKLGERNEDLAGIGHHRPMPVIAATRRRLRSNRSRSSTSASASASSAVSAARAANIFSSLLISRSFTINADGRIDRCPAAPWTGPGRQESGRPASGCHWKACTRHRVSGAGKPVMRIPAPGTL